MPKVAIIGSKETGKTCVVNFLFKYLKNFLFTKNLDKALLAGENENIIFEGNIDLEEVKKLKEKNYKIVLVKRLRKGDIHFDKDIVNRYIINNKDLEHLEKQTIKLIEDEIFKFMIFKKYQNLKTNKVTERIFLSTPHALKRFKQRYLTLQEIIKQPGNKINQQFWEELEQKENMLDKFKLAFKRACKFNLNKKYIKRRYKHDKKTEYFTDRIFVFVCNNDRIITTEIAIEHLRDYNKLIKKYN